LASGESINRSGADAVLVVLKISCSAMATVVDSVVAVGRVHAIKALAGGVV
jgi:hypothetical protein